MPWLPASDRFSVDGHYGPLAVEGWRLEAEAAVFLAHATGFCKEAWDPVVSRMLEHRPDVGIVRWDAAAHGSSGGGGETFDWWDLGNDARRVADHVGARRALAAGHSMGGASLVMAEVGHPGTFQRLVLIEPIIFPPPFARFDHPLVTGALRRRATFPDRSTAREQLRSRTVFSQWDSRALDGYVTGGFFESHGEVRLSCDPADEADFYRGGSAHGVFARLGEVGIPVLLMAGDSSTTHDRSFLELLAGRFTDAAITMVAGSHFVPMEHPEVVAEAIGGFLT